MLDIRTDLAIETIANIPTELLGVKSRMEEVDGISVHRVEVLNEAGEREIGKPIGNYVTIEARALAGREIDDQINTAKVLSKELIAMIDSALGFDKTKLTLVIGIGNRGMTADALGSKTCDKMIVTRHAYEVIAREIDARLSLVSSFAPGVLGVTGIETFEIVSSLVEKLQPQLLVVVDSLASQKTERIATSFQLTDSGIVPGGGIGNARRELSKKTLGVPVIAVGVPLVVYARTIAHDVLSELKMDTMDKRKLIDMVISDVLGDLVVTPKDIDQIVNDTGFVVSTALNLALHRSLSASDVISYVH